MRISKFVGVSALALTLSALADGAFAADTKGVDTGEVVVTALRTSSLASKTPIALTAITGAAMRAEGITGPTDLGYSVPNLSIDRQNGLQITIRGVTSTDGTEKGDPSVSALFDGVYIARPQALDIGFYDIERVEVLRGPQGTLYGRNTTGGVVNFISNKPVDHFEAAANASYGAYKTFAADGMVNVPVNDKLALRGAVSYDRRDSYIQGVPGDAYSDNPDREAYAGRLEALFKFTPNMTLLLRADDAKLKGSRTTAVRSSNFYSGAVDSTGNPIFTGNSASQELQLTGAANAQKPSVNDTSYGVSGEFNWKIDSITLTYLGSFRGYGAFENQNFNLGAPIQFAGLFTGQYRQNSHELRLAYASEKIKFQTGLYYFHENADIALYLFGLLNPTPGAEGYIYGFPQHIVHQTGEGAFAQATYSFTPRIRLTAGARYTHDTKFRYGHTVVQETLTFNPAVGDSEAQNAAGTISSRVTWKVGLDADVGAHGLVFANVSTGYKAGGFNDGCLAGTTTYGELCNQARPAAQLFYQPETLTAYQAGYKDLLLNGVLRVDAEAFYYDYKNLQLSTVANYNGAPAQTTTNAGVAHVGGIELSALIRADDHNKFDLSYNYLDAHYATYCPKGVAPSGTGCSGPDYAGRPLDRSPKSVFTAGYTFTMPLANDSKVSASVRTRFSSKYVVTAFGAPLQYVSPGHTTTEANLTYSAPGDRWSAQLFAKNIENNITVNGIDSFGNVTPGDPRTYGVRVGAKF